MTHIAYFGAITAMAIGAAPVMAGDTTPVDWSQLPDPSVQQYEDPYRDLAPQQMSDLMALVRLREQLEHEGPDAGERMQQEARTAELEAALRAADIDVEWLLSQRWAVADRRRLAAVTANGELDNQSVEIAGFLVLAPPSATGEASAYLLPDRGVCNHLPPPPPNRLVRLLMKSMPKIAGSCVPVTVRGTLRAEETRHEVVLIDHSVPMWSAWSLTTDDVRKVDMPAFDQ